MIGSAICNGQYKILAHIGEGTNGIVYKAARISDDRIVALKRLKPRISGKSLAQAFFASHVRFTSTTESPDPAIAYNENSLKNEFSFMSGLRHPNLVEVLDLDTDANGAFVLITELLEGNSLEKLLHANRTPHSHEQVVDYAVQILRGLAFLHRKGYLHRDIKPGNLFVTDQGHLKALDYGLMMERSTSNPGFAGSLAYAAPEVLKRRQYSPAADLYATGAVLFELLTGKHIPSNAVIDSGKTEHYPPDDGVAPQELTAFIERLLEPQPERRFASAEEALDQLLQFTQRDDVRETPSTLRSFILSSKLLGRDEELQALKERFDALHQNKGGICLIAGESGIGKSRLAFEFSKYVKIQGGKFYSGAFYEDASDDRSALREILRQLHPLTPAMLSDKYRTTLQLIAPDTFHNRNAGSMSMPAVIAYEKLLDFLSELAQCLDAPLTLFFEDLHFAADHSFFDSVAQRGTDLPLLILGAFRDDEVCKNFCVRHRSHSIALRHFPKEFYRAMASEIFHDHEPDQRLLQALEQYTTGNPFFIEQLFLELVDRGVLRKKGGKWELLTYEFDTIDIPRVDAILERRFAKLPAEERQFMQYLSTFSKPAPSALICFITNKILGANLEKSLNEKYIIVIEDGIVRPFHHRIQRYFYESIENKERLHYQIGAALETYAPDDVFEIAHQFERTNDIPKKRFYLDSAGRQAVGDNNWRTAIRFYTPLTQLLIAKEATRREAINSMLQLASLISDVGDWELAESQFRETLKIAQAYSDESIKGVACWRLIFMLFRQGKVSELAPLLPRARNYFESAGDYSYLAHLSHIIGATTCKIPHPMVAFTNFIEGYKIYESIIQHKKLELFRSAYATLLFLKGNVKPALALLDNEIQRNVAKNNTLQVAFAYHLRANILLQVGKTDEALDSIRNELIFAKKVGHKLLIGMVEGWIGQINVCIGNYHTALKYTRKYLQVLMDLGNYLAAAAICSDLGCQYCYVGQYEMALECFNSTLKKYREVGFKQGVGILLWEIGDVYRAKGDFALAKQSFDSSITICEELRNRRGLSDVLGCLGQLYLDRELYLLAEGSLLRAVDLARQICDRQRLMERLYALAQSYYGLGNLIRAHEAAIESASIAKDINYRSLIFSNALLQAKIEYSLCISKGKSKIDSFNTFFKTLKTLKLQAAHLAERSELSYELWALVKNAESFSDLPDTDSLRRKAHALYTQLYENIPSYVNRVRLNELEEELDDSASSRRLRYSHTG